MSLSIVHRELASTRHEQRLEGTDVGPAVGDWEVVAELDLPGSGDKDGVVVGGIVSGGSVEVLDIPPVVVLLEIELDVVDDLAAVLLPSHAKMTRRHGQTARRSTGHQAAHPSRCPGASSGNTVGSSDGGDDGVAVDVIGAVGAAVGVIVPPGVGGGEQLVVSLEVDEECKE